MSVNNVASIVGRTRRGALLAAVLRTGFWALWDQAIISASNFCTMVILARYLHSAEFGAFALAYATILFVNGLQAALITQPLSVIGATRHGDDYRRYITATLQSQVLFVVPIIIIPVLCAVAVGGTRPTILLLLALAPAVAAWQLQEFVRRVLYAEGRIRAACGNDLLSYGGQVAGILMLARTGVITNAGALCVIALTSSLAVGWGIWQIRGALRWWRLVAPVSWNYLHENWQFGKWLFGAALASWVATQVYPVLVAGFVSIADAGSFRAVQVVFGPANILLIAMDTALTPSAARAYAIDGTAGLQRFVARLMLLTAPFVVLYCVLLSILARPILKLLYGERYLNYSWLLILLSVGYLLTYVRSPAIVGLQAGKMSAPIFRAHALAGAIVLTAGVVAVREAGLLGAALANAAVTLVLSIFCWRSYMIHIRTASESRQGGGEAWESTIHEG